MSYNTGNITKLFLFHQMYNDSSNKTVNITKCQFKSKDEMQYWVWKSKYASIDEIVANIEKLHINIFCEQNKNAHLVLNKMPKLINFRSLEKNVNSHLVYKNHKSRITWFAIKRNPNVLQEIETDISKIRW